jgi:translation initiation factor 2B subunit (eIF-2B alpha/beta/delta family)
VLANGDVLNKAGTALLGWAAQGHRVPFYVLCETLKISPRVWTGDLAQLEEKEATEVLDSPIPGVTVRNFYFDRTPANLVTMVITEQGLLSKEKIGEIASSIQGVV